MSSFVAKPLTEHSWPDFAALVEKHNGVWGGCWCIAFHQKPSTTNREDKHAMVKAGHAHASLVYEGDRVVGWCQFGRTETLPRIKHRKEYEAGLGEIPDWRIACFFVDRDFRRKGVATVALRGALEQIAQLGGGVVEAYPEEVVDRKTSSSFLYTATISIFERQGFVRQRRLGMYHWVVLKFVPTVN